jgi:hypothetical protein
MKRIPFISVVFIAASSVMVSGCATITRGTTQAFVVESDPPGADVELSNGLRGKTPASFTVKRRENLVVKIKKEGFEPVEATVSSTIGDGGGTATAGNILFGGLIGLAVDGNNGSNRTLRPNPVSVKLMPLPPPMISEAKILEIPDRQEKHKRNR